MRDPRPAADPVSEDDVRLVLENESRLTLVAQPIVDLRRGVIVGYEALARFALGKPATPDRVFAAATQAGLGEDLEAVVVAHALDLALKKPPNCFLTINVDPRHLVSSRVWSVIEAQTSLRGVIFELTEHRSMGDLDLLRRALETLRERGAFIAIDDAGSGYSGLKQILDLRPQFLKIDRDLITDVHANEAKRAMIQMLGNLAGRLDAWVIAEGIESEAELHALAQLRVPLGQGYLLGRPAAPWSRLESKAEGALQSVARVGAATSVTTLDGLVEPCGICRDAVPWPAAALIAVRLENGMRPASMRLVGDEVERVRSSRELLRVKRTDSLADVGLRAATRASYLRWDPLVCVDDLGHFEGVVPMERLIGALASQHAEPVRPSVTSWPAAAEVSDVHH